MFLFVVSPPDSRKTVAYSIALLSALKGPNVVIAVEDPPEYPFIAAPQPDSRNDDGAQ
jgi:hypothetical protein